RERARGAKVGPPPAGIGLVLHRDIEAIARLADVVRTEADALPFWSFRLLADTPVCWLEVTGTGGAAEAARVVFRGLASQARASASGRLPEVGRDHGREALLLSEVHRVLVGCRQPGRAEAPDGRAGVL